MNLPKLSVRIRPHRDDRDNPTALLAMAELTIADAYVIKGLRVLARRDGPDRAPFVVWPAEKGKGSDRWFDIAHPITAEARTAALTAVLAAFEKSKEVAP